MRWAALIILAAGMYRQPPDPRPQFDAASIKQNVNCGGRVNRWGGGSLTTEYYATSCIPLRNLIRLSYAPLQHSVVRQTEVLGGAAWLDSEVYDVAARGNIQTQDRRRAMLQRFLEDRCDLKIHTETREVPVYALSVAKGGPKIQPTKAGSCRPITYSNAIESPEPATDQPALDYCESSYSLKGGTVNITALGVSMDQFADGGLDRLDRLVVNRTGLAGIFDVRLEYSPESAQAAPDATGASVFTAVQQQLGLKLSPDKGNVEVLVIDHIDKPSDN